MTVTQTAGKSKVASMFVEYLKSEGFNTEIDESGDVVFRSEGRAYYIIIDPDDNIFFRLVYPNFWPFEGESQRLRVLEACSIANAHTKVAKIFPTANNVWAAVEMFVSPLSEFHMVFPRCMSTLRVICDRFGTEMRRLT